MTLTDLTARGRDWRDRIRQFFDAPLREDATPLEICQAVLDDVERQVEPVGGDRRVFPFTTVRVHVRVPEPRRAAVEAAFAEFPRRVRERLAEVRCETRQTLEAEVTCLDDPPASWAAGQVFGVTYAVTTGASAAAAVTPPVEGPSIRLEVLAGDTAESRYECHGQTVSIGRTSDALDGDGRLRHNRIVFDDVVNGVNETVGRAHARLRYDLEAGTYRVFDEGSRNGTAVVRDGEVMTVHRRDPQGVRLRSGDVIRLGHASLRVEIGDRGSGIGDREQGIRARDA